MGWHIWVLLAVAVLAFLAFGFAGFRAGEMVAPLIALNLYAATGYAFGRLVLAGVHFFQS